MCNNKQKHCCTFLFLRNQNTQYMFYELAEALFPAVVFLLVAYWLQAYTKAEVDKEWDEINNQNQEK